MAISYRTELPEKGEMYRLYEHLGWNGFLKLDADRLRKAMEHSYYSVYAYDGPRLVATGRVVSGGVISAYLCGLGVQAEYRGRGIGSHIVRMLAAHCKENRLHLQLFCEGPLVEYYEKRGFSLFAEGMKLNE